MSKSVIIIGSGGHGRVIADTVLRSGDHVLGFLDDDLTMPATVAGIPVLGTVADYTKYRDAYFVIGIGQWSNRSRIAEELEGVKWYTAIHPQAVVSGMDTVIGEGTVVMAGAIINAGATVGRHCIINTGAIIDHDCRIEDGAHISVGSKLAGAVKIGRGTWIGIGSVVNNSISVCDDCMIGAGAVVVSSVEEPGVYVGIPARKIK